MPHYTKKLTNNSTGAKSVADILRHHICLASAFASVFVATMLAAFGLTLRTQNARIGELSRKLTKMNDVVEADTDFEFATFRVTFDEIQLNHDYWHEPYDSVAIGVLHRSREFFAAYVDAQSAKPNSTVRLAEAYFNLGRIQFAFDEFKSAREAYSLAAEQLETSQSIPRDESLIVARAVVASRLSCVQAAIGDYIQAAASSKLSIELLESIRVEDPTSCPWRMELAYSYRNLGLILACTEQGGISELERSIAANREAIRSLTTVECPLNDDEFRSAIFDRETLIDTYMILAGVLWGANRFEQAEAAIQNAIGAMNAFMDVRETLSFNDFGIPLSKYRRALAECHQNLRGLTKDCEAGRFANNPRHAVDSMPVMANRWRWLPLNWIAEKHVSHDLLAKAEARGEFEHQDAIMINWLDMEWCNGTLIEMIAAICDRVQVVILIRDDASKGQILELLRNANLDVSGIRFELVRTNSLWIRDFGPLITVSGGMPRLLDADYRNGSRFLDERVPQSFARAIGSPSDLAQVGCYVEWGAVLCNGDGLCLVSSDVLRRNERLGIEEEFVTASLKRLTGSERVIYLDPLYGESTGHLDVFATFTSADTLVLSELDASDAINSALLDRHGQFLERVNASDKQKLRVVRIPMPPRDDDLYWPTYTNVVFANGVLLVPQWPNASSQLEATAFETYRRILPNWEVIGIDCHQLGLRQGGLHCATMHVPQMPTDVNAF